jgi:peptide/nickel transport system substrate-binding protein
MSVGEELRATSTRTPLTRRGVLKGAAAAGLAAPLAGLAGRTSTGLAAVARQTNNGSTLIVGLDGSPSDLDPHSQYDYRSTIVVRSLYEGLVGLKGAATDELEGLVAESWEANDDQSVWTFKIRPGLTFHDGSACDSAAVKASFERLLAMNRGAVGVVSRFVSDPEQIETPDAETVVFNLGAPQPLFIAALASTYGPQIVNAAVAMEHEVDGDFGQAWMTISPEGTGTGGWILSSFEPGQQAILERNPNYWRGWEGNHFERVIIRVVEEASTMRQLVEAGDVDIMDRFSVDQWEAVPELQQNPNLVVDLADSTEVEYFSMTVAGPLASPEARQAMAYAFPYQEVIDGVYLGNASRANSLIAPSVLGFQEDGFYFETDLDQARELLAAAGVPEGTEMNLVLGAGAVQTAAELFQANLAQIGITLSIEPVDQGAFAALFYGDTPAEERPNFMRWSWWPDYNDAWNVLQPTTSCDSWGSKGANGGFYCNEEVDELLAEARDASTLESYEGILAEIQTIITEQDVPNICTAQPKWPTVLQSNIEGFAFNPINLGTYDFWTLSRSE